MREKLFPTLTRIGLWTVRIVIVLFVLAAIPWTYFNIKFGRQLTAELAALKAQGLPVTTTEAVSAPIPDAENAAVVYQTVFRVSFTHGEMAGNRDAPLAKLDMDALVESTGGGPMRLAPTAREVLSAPETREILDALREGSGRPDCVFAVRWEDGFGALFPHMALYRRGSKALWAETLISAEDGRTEEALDWSLVALRMSEHALTEPSLIAQLVAYAMQAITFSGMRDIVSTASISPEVAAEFEEELAGIDLTEALRVATNGERAMVCDVYGSLGRNSEDLCNLMGLPWGAPTRIYFGWAGRPLHRLDQLLYLEFTEREFALLTQPYRDSKAELDALEDEMQARLSPGTAPTRKVLLASVIMPAYSRVARSRDRARAQIDLCRVAMALKAYKYEHGEYPATLDEGWPKDVFSGEAFVYRRDGEGFVLYSIGMDLDDDEGATQYDEGRGAEDCDIVWECVK